MSQIDSVDVICPNCQRKQNVSVWHSVNGTLDPKLRTELMEGRLNSFTCKKCKQVYTLDFPVLYHDMERHFAVEFYPESFMHEDEFIREFLEPGDLDLRDDTDALPADSEGAQYLEHAHIVFDLAELRRYVLFREKVYEAGSKREKSQAGG